MKVIILCVLLVAATAAHFEEELTGGCDAYQCYRSCVTSGAKEGFCGNNDCVCTGNRPHTISFEQDLLKNIAAVNIGAEAPRAAAAAACDGKQCVLYCQKMGKNGGACVAGRCLCF